MRTGADVEWRYCGRFGYMKQNAMPLPNLTWIDEAEAVRRYHDPSKELTIVPPVDESTGLVPWFITVTTAELPSFVVTYQGLPGVPVSRAWWRRSADGRLFGHMAEVWSYPPVEEILFRDESLALVHATVVNKEDGTGWLRVREKGSTMDTTADRRFDPAPLYRPVPEWGQWDELANAELPSE